MIHTGGGGMVDINKAMEFKDVCKPLVQLLKNTFKNEHVEITIGELSYPGWSTCDPYCQIFYSEAINQFNKKFGISQCLNCNRIYAKEIEETK